MNDLNLMRAAALNRAILDRQETDKNIKRKALIIANHELCLQNEEKEKRAAELIIANKELAFQNQEKEKRAAELIIANNELAFQNQEKEKRAAELILANIELAFQNEEKEKRAAELIIANRELALQNLEKEKREADLIAINIKLAFKNQERDMRAAELKMVNSELQKAEEFQKEYIKGLEEMMFLTSHKVRQPIANILGFSNMLDQSMHSPNDLKLSVDCIKQSALILEAFTKELTDFICRLDRKEKDKTIFNGNIL